MHARHTHIKNLLDIPTTSPPGCCYGGAVLEWLYSLRALCVWVWPSTFGGGLQPQKLPSRSSPDQLASKATFNWVLSCFWRQNWFLLPCLRWALTTSLQLVHGITMTQGVALQRITQGHVEDEMPTVPTVCFEQSLQVGVPHGSRQIRTRYVLHVAGAVDQTVPHKVPHEALKVDPRVDLSPGRVESSLSNIYSLISLIKLLNRWKRTCARETHKQPHERQTSFALLKQIYLALF